MQEQSCETDGIVGPMPWGFHPVMALFDFVLANFLSVSQPGPRSDCLFGARG